MNLFLPDLTLNNVFELEPAYLKKQGIKGVIFDLDNTLAYHQEPVPTKEISAFLNQLKEQGFYVAISSNNTQERVEEFCKEWPFCFVHQARKPLFFKTLKPFRKMGFQNKELCMVGDQLFTDMLGGNAFGLHTVLVRPFDPNETKFIRFKRKLEKLLLKQEG